MYEEIGFMAASFPWTPDDIRIRVTRAVGHYWQMRTGQAASGGLDTGSRSEVTGGQHLTGFLGLLVELTGIAGYHTSEIRTSDGVVIPGFYRPNKKWDLVVVRDGRLCAALELKSQVGPSFGNNFNNRTEEALGNAVDLWRAFQEKVLGAHPPWLGYIFLLEDALKSSRAVGLPNAVFESDPIFRDTSYAERYQILCQRLVLERHYNAAAFVLSKRATDGGYTEPSKDLAIEPFLKAFYGHLIGCL